MDVILISAKAILPLFAFMMLGFWIKKRDLLSETATRQINILVFRFFLPIMCAETIYKANLREDVELLPVLMVTFGIIGIFLISWLIVPRFIKDKTQIPVMIQGIYKSNYAILGIPIAISIYGAENIGVVSVIAVILVPLNNALSAFIFERYTGKATSGSKLVLNIIRNPLVLGSLAGLILNLTGIVIPDWILSGIFSKLGAMATPLSMIALGASFVFSQIRTYRRPLFWACLAKLVLVPSLIIPLSIILGARGAGLVGITIYAASPNAVNSYSTAVAMGGDADLANEIVVMTSLLSMITMFLWFVMIGFAVGF